AGKAVAWQLPQIKSSFLSRTIRPEKRGHVFLSGECHSLFFGTSGSCSRRPAGDVTCGQATSALRFPQGRGYKIRVREYPKLPPRLRWIFTHNPLFFVTFCTYERRNLLASDAMHAAFVAFASQANSRHDV